jgi:ribosomal-protein-alanine acetyltransferase
MSALLQHPAPHLRPMHEEDVPGVMVVELLNYPYPWTEGIMRDCLRARYSCWVYEAGDRVIGYGILSAGAGEAHVLNISVHPDYQGRGLGRELMVHLLDRAREYGADTVFLEVRPSNRAAVHLYESIGFNQAGLRRDYYPAARGREDALIMALAL